MPNTERDLRVWELFLSTVTVKTNDDLEDTDPVSIWASPMELV